MFAGSVALMHFVLEFPFPIAIVSREKVLRAGEWSFCELHDPKPYKVR